MRTVYSPHYLPSTFLVMERCLLGTAIRFCPSITFSPRSNLFIAFGRPGLLGCCTKSRRMLKASAKTNVNGGAIAIGHPLGASGARIMTTLVNAREQHGGPRAVGHQTARDQDDQTQLPNGDGDLGVLSSASSRALAAIRAVTPGCLLRRRGALGTCPCGPIPEGG